MIGSERSSNFRCRAIIRTLSFKVAKGKFVGGLGRLGPPFLIPAVGRAHPTKLFVATLDSAGALYFLINTPSGTR